MTKIIFIGQIDVLNHESGPILEQVNRIEIKSQLKDPTERKIQVENAYLDTLRILEEAGSFCDRPFASPHELEVGVTCHISGEMYALVFDKTSGAQYETISLYDGDEKLEDAHIQLENLLTKK